MCSIGFIRLEDSWLLFKNRDRLKEEKINNYIEANGNALLFKDKEMPGTWLGINKHGLAAATAWGPVIKVAGRRVPENFEVLEKVLAEAKTVEDAKTLYVEPAMELGRSYNLIFTDGRTTFAVEQLRKLNAEHESSLRTLRTNHFLLLRSYNLENERFRISKARYAKLEELTAGVKRAEDLYDVLSYCSLENPMEDVCRDGEHVTVASAILEVKDKDVTAHNCLNKLPSKGGFKRKRWKLP